MSSSKGEGAHTSFFAARRARDERCVEKDQITRRLIKGLRIRRARDFTAVVMPSMWGPEVAWLHARGVPTANMFAIERNAIIHATFAERGLRTTPRASYVHDAIDHVPWSRVDLAYLDFFGQPNGDHIDAMRKLFRLCLGPDSRLWITFGVNRGKTFSCTINRRLRGVDAYGEAYVRAAWALVPDASPIRRVVNHRYKTSTAHHPANFILTEVQL